MAPSKAIHLPGERALGTRMVDAEPCLSDSFENAQSWIFKIRSCVLRSCLGIVRLIKNRAQEEHIVSNNIVFTPGRQMYHFTQLRQEVGDLQLIGMMAQRLLNTSQLSIPMAVRAATDQFEMLDQLQQGSPVFSQMRADAGFGRLGVDPSPVKAEVQFIEHKGE